MPRRIQLRRTAGWRKPDGAVVVARPSRWGNLFRVGEPYVAMFENGLEDGDVRDRDHAVSLFRRWVTRPGPPDLLDEIRRELAGRDLCCWCPLDQPCHADVLLDIANEHGAPWCRVGGWLAAHRVYDLGAGELVRGQRLLATFCGMSVRAVPVPAGDERARCERCVTAGPRDYPVFLPQAERLDGVDLDALDVR